MKALADCTRGLAKAGLLAIAIVVATVTQIQETPSADAAHTRLFASLSSSNAQRVSTVVLVPNGPPKNLYFWAQDVDNVSGASAFQVGFDYDSSILTVSAFDQDSTWLASSGRSVACVGSDIGPTTAYAACNTLQPPPPFGATGTGLLATITLQPGAVIGASLLTFTDDNTFLIDTPVDPDDLAHIPALVFPVQTVVAECADFTDDGLVRIPDILVVVANYGMDPSNPSTPNPGADLDQSGLILIPDILISVAEFGITCPA